MDSTKKTVLIIEDDSVLAKMYSQKLISVGYQVLTAGDGEEGLKMVLENDVDLILTDIMLPRVSGIDFLKNLKKHPKKSKLPIIAWSNLADTTEKETALSLGAKEYLIKGKVTLDEVVNTVKKYI